MPFKFDANGNIVTTGEGDKKQPVYVYADGREAPFDADSTLANISRLNGEAKGNRERAELAESKLKAFDGIEDGEAARKALELTKNIKEGDLIAAGKVQEIKDAAAASAKQAVADATRAAEAREKALADENSTLTANLSDHIIGGTVFFNDAGVFISGTTSSVFVVPEKTAYAIINITSDHLKEQLEAGGTSTAYAPYGNTFKFPLVGSAGSRMLATGVQVCRTGGRGERQCVSGPFRHQPGHNILHGSRQRACKLARKHHHFAAVKCSPSGSVRLRANVRCTLLLAEKYGVAHQSTFYMHVAPQTRFGGFFHFYHLKGKYG